MGKVIFVVDPNQFDEYKDCNVTVYKSTMLHWLVDMNKPYTPKTEEDVIFDNHYDIFNKHYELKTWLEENCQDDVYIDIDSNEYIDDVPSVFFKNDEDALKFKLTWG